MPSWGLVYEMAAFFLIAELSLAAICLTWYKNALASQSEYRATEEKCTALLHQYVAEVSRGRIQASEADFWKSLVMILALRRHSDEEVASIIEDAEFELSRYLGSVREMWVDRLLDAAESQPPNLREGLRAFVEKHFPNT